MIIFNFSHPLTPHQIKQIEDLIGKKVDEVMDIYTQIEPNQPIVPQIRILVDSCNLSLDQWQTLPIIINPPSLNFIAVTLLAELHGRCGYFPAHLRLRPKNNTLPPQFEVAEIINLQEVRDEARRRR
ncbi:MAG: hypothetical protein BWX92_03325 [Deltaproteobacteria bacterium ADurb.Bin135]|nr:MAG: hypothetical protein BWX92_03325 [Deltaproteobacteria bacterium ADurb.Bin135]